MPTQRRRVGADKVPPVERDDFWDDRRERGADSDDGWDEARIVATALGEIETGGARP